MPQQDADGGVAQRIDQIEQPVLVEVADSTQVFVTTGGRVSHGTERHRGHRPLVEPDLKCVVGLVDNRKVQPAIVVKVGNGNTTREFVGAEHRGGTVECSVAIPQQKTDLVRQVLDHHQVGVAV